MKLTFGVLFVVATATVAAHALAPVTVPEINPAVIPTAVALLGGSILVVRAYLKK